MVWEVHQAILEGEVQHFLQAILVNDQRKLHALCVLDVILRQEAILHLGEVTTMIKGLSIISCPIKIDQNDQNLKILEECQYPSISFQPQAMVSPSSLPISPRSAGLRIPT